MRKRESFPKSFAGGIVYLCVLFFIIWLTRTFFPEYLTQNNFQWLLIIIIFISLIKISDNTPRRKESGEFPGHLQWAFDDINVDYIKVNEEVTARNVTIVNKNGQAVLRIGLDILGDEEGSPVLEIFDKSGTNTKLYGGLAEIGEQLQKLLHMVPPPWEEDFEETHKEDNGYLGPLV